MIVFFTLGIDVSDEVEVEFEGTVIEVRSVDEIGRRLV
jgi:hypothetical protein